MANDCMECVEGRAVALGLCADCLAGEPVEAVVRQIARLTRELEEARACCKWEEGNQRRALEYWDGEYGTTLAEEFPYGCDTIEHVAEALIVARLELEAARTAFAAAMEYVHESHHAEIVATLEAKGIDLDALASTPPDTEGDDV